MPPRKKRKSFASTQKPHRETQDDARDSAHSRVVVAGYNGPITRSRRSSRTIHCLPLEVLGEILILALPTDQEIYDELYDDERSRERQNLINPPLVFSAVCSSWRFLALSTPRLWNRAFIHVPPNINRAQAKRKATDLVQWIERARSLPITLHISDDSVKPPNAKRPITSVINDHAARWESLYFQDSHPSSSLFDFDRLHSLRRLYSPYSNPVSRANETVPWAHLTHLQIGISVSCWDAAIIFMKCPKLVYLSILVGPSTIGQSAVPVVLEDLVTFNLESHSEDGLHTVIHQLSLPSLREFFIDRVSTRAIQPLLTLLSRSSCSLDKFRIHGVYLASGDYLNVLTHTSCDSLTSLTLRPSLHPVVGPGDGELFRRLTLHRNDTVCRRLTFLAIDYCIPTSAHPALLNMVESRINSQVPEEPALRFLQLHVREENIAELDKVGRKSGMEYSRKTTIFAPVSFTVWFRRQGFREPPNFGEPFCSWS